MADALDLLENLELVNVTQLATDTLEEKEEVMADMNAAQLAEGKRSTGTDIRPEYHPLTVEIKRGKSGLSAVTDRVTLHDEGDYYRSLYADVKGDEIEHGAKDWKDEKLRKKYGETIHGLTEENQYDLVEQHLRPSMEEKLHEATGL